ncbi:MAG: type II toxin-antitoxin system RelE/ParE family toxin [Candidatus Latescibacterota bacterium]
MEVQFRTRRLRKQYEHSKEAEKAYGRDVARRYIQRVEIMKKARHIEELRSLPGLDCHSLKGNRQGQWAVKLTGFTRLIFTLEGERLEVARIEEVSKHYDD